MEATIDTVKTALGFGTPAKESGTEPVNAETGAGTAAEPYDAGNKEENPTTAPTEVNGKPEPLTEPLELTEPKEGTAPVSDEVAGIAPTSTAAETATIEKPEPAAEKALAESAPIREPEPELNAATPADAAKGPAEAAAVAAATKHAATEKAAPSSDAKKENKIGSAGWFKDTLRRKSKTPAAEKPESKKEAAATEKKEAVVAPVPAPVEKKKEAPAPVEKKETAAAPVPIPVEKPAAPKAEKVKEEKPAKAEKPKKERNMSMDLSKFNPFKRKSKTGIEEDNSEEKKIDELSKLPEVAAGGAAVGAGAAVVEHKEAEKKAEPTAANELSNNVPKGTAEPAADKDLPPLTDSKTLDEPEPVVAKETAPVETVAETTPVVDAKEAPSTAAHTTTTPVAPIEDNVAPDESAPGVPAIVEPVDKGKGPEKTSTGPQGENLSAIPTAGGVRLGSSAYERRTSVAPQAAHHESVGEKIKDVLLEGPLQTSHIKTDEEKAAEAETKTDIPKRRQSVMDKLKSKLKM